MAVDAFALVLAILALGALFARLRLLPDNAAESLNMVVLHVCLPAAVLRYVPRLHWDPALAAVVATPWLLALVAIVLVSALARGLRFRRDEAAVVKTLGHIDLVNLFHQLHSIPTDIINSADKR